MPETLGVEQEQPLVNGKPSLCVGCPRQNETCVTRGVFNPDARITFIAENPSWASLSTNPPSPFVGSNGILLRGLAQKLTRMYQDKFDGVRFPYSAVYAAGCGDNPDPDKKVFEKCKEIWRSQWVSHYAQQTGPHVIVPFGLPAAKSAGITAKKIMDIRGRVQQRMLGPRQVMIVPTLSLASLYAKPGLSEVALQDIERALRLAYLDEYTPPKTIEELSKDYRFPKTIEEVQALCDEIIEYYDPQKQDGPLNWPISVDTETNTLKPFRGGSKVLMISFAWDDGKACAILLDHPKNTWYDPAEAWKAVKKVLECPKPKVFHNMKYDAQFLERVYDIRINNVMWDTMCGQHWISEDQKGVYGLKALAPSYAPEFEGYEEKLHDALRTGEEPVPTEEDVLKEAQEMAAAEGSSLSGSSDWFEPFERSDSNRNENKDEEDEAAVEVDLDLLPDNSAWEAMPEFPFGADDKLVKNYLRAQKDWFKFDSVLNVKRRNSALKRWQMAATALGLPTPKPKPSRIARVDNGFADIKLEVILPYAAADADLTRIILKKQFRRINLEGYFEQAKKVMTDLYIPAARALGSMEFIGAKVDLDLARNYSAQLTDMLDTAQGAIYGLACRKFKILASRQLGDVLIAMGFNRIKETANNEMSTSKDVLVSYQKQLVDRMRSPTDLSERENDQRRLDFIESVLLYRAAYKMKTSFLQRIREYSALDGHIHTTFHLTGTSTGRLSSARLNLQNLPLYMCRVTRPNPDDPENPVVIHTGFNVKKLLVPESEDEVFWNLDIKQAEIRVACYYSNDQALIQALNNNLDIHTFFVTKIKHPTLDGDALMEQYKHYKSLVDAEDREISQFRQAVKRVVFGTLYGAGPAKIAAQIGGGYAKEDARKIIDALFTAFPGIQDYINRTKSAVTRNGRVITVFGRHRRFMLQAVSSELRSKAEREAVNSLIQSTSSDLVMAQLCEIVDHIHEIEGVVRLTVHDSMAGTVKRHRVRDLQAFFDYWLVTRIKERFPWLPVDFAYDLAVGPSYGEEVKYKKWLEENPE